MKFWDFWSESASQWTLERMQRDQHPGIDGVDGKEVSPGQAYLEVWLRSMYVCKLRVAHHRFFGSVHSSISVAQQSAGATRHEFVTVTTPQELRDQDPKHVDRVVMRNLRLFGPVPFVGDDLAMKVALFSLRSTDLAAPFLDLLGELSTAAGVALVAQAKPFLGPLKRGLDLIAGGDRTLEIAYQIQCKPVVTECLVVTRMPKGMFRSRDYELDADWTLIERSSRRPFTEAPYIAITVQRTPTRQVWWEVCGLQDAWSELKKYVTDQPDQDQAEKALEAFRRRVMFCPDLLMVDREQAFADMERDVRAAFRGFRKQALGGPLARLTPLEEIRFAQRST